jgi:hypothetical protein
MDCAGVHYSTYKEGLCRRPLQRLQGRTLQASITAPIRKDSAGVHYSAYKEGLCRRPLQRLQGRTLQASITAPTRKDSAGVYCSLGLRSSSAAPARKDSGVSVHCLPAQTKSVAVTVGHWHGPSHRVEYAGPGESDSVTSVSLSGASEHSGLT